MIVVGSRGLPLGVLVSFFPRISADEYVRVGGVDAACCGVILRLALLPFLAIYIIRILNHLMDSHLPHDDVREGILSMLRTELLLDMVLRVDGDVLLCWCGVENNCGSDSSLNIWPTSNATAPVESSIAYEGSALARFPCNTRFVLGDSAQGAAPRCSKDTFEPPPDGVSG